MNIMKIYYELGSIGIIHTGMGSTLTLQTAQTATDPLGDDPEFGTRLIACTVIGSTDTNITTIRMNKICALFPEDQIQAIWNELEPHFDKAYYAQHLRDLAYEIRTFPLANYCFDGQREQDKKVHEELITS